MSLWHKRVGVSNIMILHQKTHHSFQSNKTIRALNLESNSITADMVINIIKSTASTKGLEELKVTNQFTGQFLGSALEYAIIELLPKVPHLVKLGVRMEFRDSLNKCAMALAKNLDRSKCRQTWSSLTAITRLITFQDDKLRTERSPSNSIRLAKLDQRLLEINKTWIFAIDFGTR